MWPILALRTSYKAARRETTFIPVSPKTLRFAGPAKDPLNLRLVRELTPQREAVASKSWDGDFSYSLITNEMARCVPRVL